MSRNVFVIGKGSSHDEAMGDVERERDVAFRDLLGFDRVRFARRYDVDALLADAEDELEAFDGPVDAITTYWDFPSSCLVPILCERRGLPTAGLAPAVRCEHKQWSRLLQQEVAPEATPRFEAVDPFADDAAEIDLPFPFWLKPIKSYSGHLGFRIDDRDDLDRALEILRRRIHRLGEPFQTVLERVDDVPAEVVPGTYALAEQIIDGQQCTLEGHVHQGEVRVHGLFDIHREEDGSTFSDYTYPSRLPADARERMREIATRLMQRCDYGQAPFNIEFFHDADADRTWILEVNPRISQEHVDLMRWVDGSTNLEVMAQLALDREPTLEARAGPCEVAQKRFLRTRDDAVVTRAPTDDEIAELEARHAPCHLSVDVAEGTRLSELEDQESYSYLLGYVHLGGASTAELDDRFRRLREELPLDLATAD